MTSKPSSLSSAQTSLLAWDFDNRLVSVDTDTDTDTDGTVDTTYTYDAIGRRVTKSNTVYVCDDTQTLAEYELGTAAGSPIEQYVYGTYIDEPIVKVSTGGLSYYHRNQQYSITGLTDAAGNVLEHYVYDAYGDAEFLDAGSYHSSLGPSGTPTRTLARIDRCHPTVVDDLANFGTLP